MCSEGPTEVATREHDSVSRKWSTSDAQRSAAFRQDNFTAYATEKSASGNTDGRSVDVTGF